MQLELNQLSLQYSHLRVVDDGRVDRLAASIRRLGQCEPILVVGAGSEFVVVDGFKRVAALQALCEDLVEVVVLQGPVADALITVHMMRRTVPGSALEDAWFLRELMSHTGMSQAELAQRLDRSKSWISRRLALLSLPQSVEDAIRRGSVSAQVATKYLVALARANAEDCAKLVAGVAPHGVTVRQFGLLYDAYRGASDEHRERIVDNPLLYLQAAEHAGTPLSDGVGPEPIERDLRMATAICWRLRDRLVEAPTAPACIKPRFEALVAALDAVREVVDA